MIQLLLIVLKYLALGLFTVGTVMLILATINNARKRRRAGYVYAGAAVLCGVIAFGLWGVDLTAAETSDREEAADAFAQNFGFAPPPEVLEIKLKNVVVGDAFAQWMAFTYTPVVLDRIVAHDQPLTIALKQTRPFQDIVRDVYNGKNANRPDWAASPDGRAERIYFKTDFLDHSFSEYQLWVDSTQGMVHLHVSYFD